MLWEVSWKAKRLERLKTGAWGVSWETFGTSKKSLGSLLDASGGLLEASGSLLGLIWEFWESQGLPFWRFWGLLDVSWSLLERSWVLVGGSWESLGSLLGAF